MPSRLRKGDLVIVISGEEKGKTGKVSRVFAEHGMVVVEGVALRKRHMRPNPRAPQGGIIEREQPIFASKVMLVDPKSGKGSRVRFTITPAKGDKKAKTTRIAVKSGEEVAYATVKKD
jgi:large subunit ribosomal protein L24